MDATVVRDWAAECVRSLRHLRGEIDDINVYPVADSDTGSNLLATVSAGQDTLTAGDADVADSLPEGGVGDALTAFAAGAVRAARGNSGVILSQALRGLAGSVGERRALDGETLAHALGDADTFATHSVARPVEGTMLSVFHAAADGAREAGHAPAHVVAEAAATAAARAVAATPGQLPELAHAGVVDAGGRGVVVVLDALAAALAGTVGSRRGERAAYPIGVGDRVLRPPEWEVMYLLDGLRDTGARSLRERLDAIGDSVSIADDGVGTHAVHVHCADIGAALEVGIDFGTPHRVRVEPLPQASPGVPAHPDTPAQRRARGVVVVVRGDPLAELVAREGVSVLRVARDGRPDEEQLLAHIEAAGTDHVTVLAVAPELTEVAERVSARETSGQPDTVVVPCQSPVQLLAALAVHDARRRAGDDVVAMAEAAAATRRGELRIAAEESLTWLGTAESGALVGLVDGEVVAIERRHATAGGVRDAVVRVLGRMLALGGELVTVLTGERAPEGLGDTIAEWVAEAHPEVEFVCYSGGQDDAVVLIGVE